MLFVLVQLFVAVATAAGSYYIYDLPSFASLAPCAQYAVSVNVQTLTVNRCPAPVESLQSCACTKDQNSAAILSEISAWVFDYCAKTATEDASSASAVFSGYCNTNAAITTAAPSTATNTVSQYIVDLSAYSDLAPCAAYALSYDAQYLASSKCPAGAAEVVSCLCTKNGNSLDVSEYISRDVEFYCGSTKLEDVSSAQAVFAGYCGLGNGTSSFWTPSALAGHVTYYITDLLQYSSLAPCAQSALLSRVQYYTTSYCPAPPLSLVSCACVKDHNSQGLSSGIRVDVGFSCGSTASADIVSALSVFDYYCSAGKGLVTAQGVTVHATNGGSGASPTATRTSSGSNPTHDPGTSTVFQTKAPIAAVVGGSVGGVIFLLLVIFIWLHYRKTHLNTQPPTATTSGFEGGGGYPYDSSKAELPINQLARASVRNPADREQAPINQGQMLVSPAEEKNSVEHNVTPEMPNTPAQYHAQVHGGSQIQELPYNIAYYEVHGQTSVQEIPHNISYHEVYGSQQHPIELPGRSANANGLQPHDMDGSHY